VNEKPKKEGGRFAVSFAQILLNRTQDSQKQKEKFSLSNAEKVCFFSCLQLP
jgi:hypothetical protein